jgi:hypothetical protein
MLAHNIRATYVFAAILPWTFAAPIPASTYGPSLHLVSASPSGQLNIGGVDCMR